jgi:multidrug efflux pump subunit AcrA (membrane-fusion protein)
VSGEIVRIDFEEGKMAKAGDVLAEIDSRTYDAQLSQAKGVLARDEARLENARLLKTSWAFRVAVGEGPEGEVRRIRGRSLSS